MAPPHPAHDLPANIRTDHVVRTLAPATGHKPRGPVVPVTPNQAPHPADAQSQPDSRLALQQAIRHNLPNHSRTIRLPAAHQHLLLPQNPALQVQQNKSAMLPKKGTSVLWRKGTLQLWAGTSLCGTRSGAAHGNRCRRTCHRRLPQCAGAVRLAQCKAIGSAKCIRRFPQASAWLTDHSRT